VRRLNCMQDARGACWVVDAPSTPVPWKTSTSTMGLPSRAYLQGRARRERERVQGSEDGDTVRHAHTREAPRGGAVRQHVLDRGLIGPR
jgi:hypothetical protein